MKEISKSNVVKEICTDDGGQKKFSELEEYLEPYSIDDIGILDLGDLTDWVIPIADNVVGLGKSSFGRHYISKSREMWRDDEKKDEFQKILSDCHTVHITFRK